MKKFCLLFCSIIITLIIISFIDYKLALNNKTKPLFSIKENIQEDQVEIYYGLFYKLYKCLAEDEHYISTSIFSNYKKNICPKSFKLNFENGYYINKNNIRIEKENFEHLKNFYSIDEINNMTQDDINNAYKKISNYSPIIK